MKLNTQVPISPFYEKQRSIRFTHPAFARHNLLKTIFTVIKRYSPCQYLPLASQCLEKGHFFYISFQVLRIPPSAQSRVWRQGSVSTAEELQGEAVPPNESRTRTASGMCSAVCQILPARVEIFRLRSLLEAPPRSREAHRRSPRLAGTGCFTCRMAFLPPATTMPLCWEVPGVPEVPGTRHDF